MVYPTSVAEVSPPGVWQIATTTAITATIKDHNLYINGKQTVKNIPKSLGLAPAHGVALEMFFTSYTRYYPYEQISDWDYYSPIVISPDKNRIAFLYGRFVLSGTTDRPTPELEPVASVLLVYDLDGHLVFKKDLTHRYVYGHDYGNLRDTSNALPDHFPDSDAVVVRTYSGKERDVGSPTLYFFKRPNGRFTPESIFLLQRVRRSYVTIRKDLFP